MITKHPFSFIVCIILLLSLSSNGLTASSSIPSNQVSEEKTKNPSETFSVQDLFTSQMNDIINTIAEENFDLALKKVKQYEQGRKIDLSDTQKAHIRYIKLYSTAGLVTKNKRNHNDVRGLLKGYLGQEIILNFKPITAGNKMPFNQIQVEQDSPTLIKTVSTNDKGINIFCFVNVRLKDKFDLTKHVGKDAYLIGKLESYKVSRDDVNSWIADITLSDGSVKILEDEFAKN